MEAVGGHRDLYGTSAEIKVGVLKSGVIVDLVTVPD